MRVNLRMALLNPKMFNLYVKEWHGRRVCEGYKSGVAALVAGGIVVLMLNDAEFAASMAPLVKWGMIAVPAGFSIYGIMAIFFPSALFWLTHQHEDVKRALADKRHQ
ncbi:L-arabinose transport protein [Rhodovulum sulfidophilum]|uniref:L-arabinose transport protein n=1 Tax=Rhodovulum sulfidophilum TaxID=35806 RepID=A0A0D6B668_RHOSU|nr:L-arabinose transport protein [Rhodovulum sulfidophilum]BAQ70391.1 L-arabinose transport protein [Rhodovulum sulfidophilum]